MDAPAPDVASAVVVTTVSQHADRLIAGPACRSISPPGAQSLCPSASLHRSDQIDVAYPESNGKLIKRDDRRVTAATFKAADVLLAKTRNVCELLLGQALLLPEPFDVSADQSAHIHAQEVSGLHSLSLSTIVCIVRWSSGSLEHAATIDGQLQAADAATR